MQRGKFGGEPHVHPWWSQRSFAIVLALVSIVPLLLPPIAPLIDLPGHMGRYRVQLDYNNFAILRSYYGFQWSLIGNLGIDLLIIPFSKIFGLELGVKLIVITIPALTVTGLLWIAREVHGDVPPTALFALPLAYGHPFLFGFVNFALAMALALNAFALWLRLARLNRLRLRAALFVVIGPLLWLVHTFGWGTLGVLAFSAELIRQHDRSRSWPQSVVWAGIHCLSLAPPLLLMLVWRSGHVGGVTGGWFRWEQKWEWLRMTLRDRWEIYDLASLALIAAVPVFALVHPRMSFSRNLAASALFLAAVFALLPRVVFGSAYADMRITPFMLAIAVVAVRMRPRAGPRLVTGIAIAGLVFFGLRTTATAASLAMASRDYDRALAALDYVPRGARLVSFVGHPCRTIWSTNRMEHLPAIALVRKLAYTNDQWSMAGAQLLTSRWMEAGGFRHDPSQIVTAGPCRGEYWRSIDRALALFPRSVFDYVWLIDPPAFDRHLTYGLKLVWTNGRDSLYRVEDRRMLIPAS